MHLIPTPKAWNQEPNAPYFLSFHFGAISYMELAIWGGYNPEEMDITV